MAIAGGLSAQIGFGDEGGTYGTAVAVDRFLEFNSESLQQNIERVESEGLRPNRRVLPSTHRQDGRVGIEGDVEFEVHNKGFGLLLEHMLGSIATSQPDNSGSPTVYEHFATVGALDGKSLTVQVGRTGVDGTTRAFTYAGCKIAEWELSCEVDGHLMLTLTLDGASETTATALATASYATATIPLVWTGAAINVGGSEIPLTSFSLSGSNGLKTDRYFMSATTPTKKREPLEGAELREYTGELSGEFIDLTAYQRFVDGTTAALVATFSGGAIDATYDYAVAIELPAVQFDGETPNVGGPDVIEQSLPFKVLDSADGDGPVQITYTSTDSTA